MKIYRVHSFKEKNSLSDLLNRSYGEIIAQENQILEESRKINNFKGYSYAAHSTVEFKHSAQPNWREDLICPLSGLNNRLRAAIHILEFEFSPEQDASIFISEQVTPLYSFLKKKYTKLKGSEYLGESIKPGEINKNGIRHEDLTNLSFEDESLDFILSFEVFEHIPSPEDAFKSCYQKLKKDGVLFFTVPFLLNEEKNVVRAQIDNKGRIIHFKEPEYHGNPVNEEGSLCFTQFGWEMLDQLRNLGFKDSYAVLYWSKEFAYLGGHQALFCAIK